MRLLTTALLAAALGLGPAGISAALAGPCAERAACCCAAPADDCPSASAPACGCVVDTGGAPLPAAPAAPAPTDARAPLALATPATSQGLDAPPALLSSAAASPGTYHGSRLYLRHGVFRC